MEISPPKSQTFIWKFTRVITGIYIVHTFEVCTLKFQLLEAPELDNSPTELQTTEI